MAVLALGVGIALSSFSRVSSDKQTDFYWFTPAKVFIIQNTLASEETRTGFNTSSTPPATLKEDGYTPSQVNVGPPPTIKTGQTPSEQLYSHP